MGRGVLGQPHASLEAQGRQGEARGHVAAVPGTQTFSLASSSGRGKLWAERAPRVRGLCRHPRPVVAKAWDLTRAQKSIAHQTPRAREPESLADAHSEPQLPPYPAQRPPL